MWLWLLISRTKKKWSGPPQYEDPTGKLMMLPTDMVSPVNLLLSMLAGLRLTLAMACCLQPNVYTLVDTTTRRTHALV